MERYRVQAYTERPDGTKVFCICDFRDEAKTGKSPIVDEPNRACHWLFTDRVEAEKAAFDLNCAER